MTHVYSRKAYQEDEAFAQVVESTANLANNKEHHIELIQEEYPDLTIVPLWTYEHSGMSIDTFQRCSFDSSADAFGATSDLTELDEVLSTINEEL